jgi:hypothetical protein
MRNYLYLALILISINTNAATKLDIENGLKPYKERCMYGGVKLNTKSERSFISIFSVECTHYTVLLTTNIYKDTGFDSNLAEIELSRKHENKKLSSILRRPPAKSLYNRYKTITNGTTVNFLEYKDFKNLMSYIYKKRLPYSMNTIEDLKRLNGKKGLVITQQVDVNFLKLDDAYEFVEYVTKNYFKSPVTKMTVSN